MKLSYIMCDPVPDLDELSRRMALLAGLGYQGIELVATHPLGFSIEDLIERSSRNGLPIISFLTGWSYANEHLCLASPDPDVRRRAVARIGDYVRLAAGCGALAVVGLMQGLRSDEPDGSMALERIAEALGTAAQVAEQESVALVLEPVNHLQVGYIHTAEQAAAMTARVDSPALGYMLDTIHMNIEETSIERTIRDHAGRIRHFHLCETNGGRFGTGSLDFPRVLQSLRESGYDGFVSVKIYRNGPWDESGRAAIEFLRECHQAWN